MASRCEGVLNKITALSNRLPTSNNPLVIITGIPTAGALILVEAYATLRGCSGDEIRAAEERTPTRR